MPGKQTTELVAGDRVATTSIIDFDFSIPVVSRSLVKKRPGAIREVRNAVRTGAGYVVWFTDGAKSFPVHGRTVWQLK